MLFLIINFIAAEVQLSVDSDSIIIEFRKDIDQYTVFTKDELKYYPKTESFVISGTTNIHNVHVYFYEPTDPLTLTLSNLHANIANSSFISISGENDVNLIIKSDVSISCQKYDPIYFTDALSPKITIENGARIEHKAGYDLIGGIGKLTLDSCNLRCGGIAGKEISVKNSNLNIEGSKLAIGGKSVTSISIENSKITASSKLDYVIGSLSEKLKSILIKDSSVDASLFAPGVGLGSKNSTINIENSNVQVGSENLAIQAEALKINSQSSLSVHGKNENLIDSPSFEFALPQVKFNGIKALKGSYLIADGKQLTLNGNDDSIIFSVSSPGTYKFSLIIDGVTVPLTTSDKNGDFIIGNGLNSFSDLITAEKAEEKSSKKSLVIAISVIFPIIIIFVIGVVLYLKCRGRSQKEDSDIFMASFLEN